MCVCTYWGEEKWGKRKGGEERGNEGTSWPTGNDRNPVMLYDIMASLLVKVSGL